MPGGNCSVLRGCRCFHSGHVLLNSVRNMSDFDDGFFVAAIDKGVEHEVLPLSMSILPCTFAADKVCLTASEQLQPGDNTFRSVAEVALHLCWPHVGWH